MGCKLAFSVTFVNKLIFWISPLCALIVVLQLLLIIPAIVTSFTRKPSLLHANIHESCYIGYYIYTCTKQQQKLLLETTSFLSYNIIKDFGKYNFKITSKRYLIIRKKKVWLECVPFPSLLLPLSWNITPLIMMLSYSKFLLHVLYLIINELISL